MAAIPTKHTIFRDYYPSATLKAPVPLFVATKRTTITGLHYKLAFRAIRQDAVIFWGIGVSTDATEEKNPMIKDPNLTTDVFVRPRDLLHADFEAVTAPRLQATFPWSNKIVVAEVGPVCGSCEQKIDIPLATSYHYNTGKVATRRTLEPGELLFLFARSNKYDPEPDQADTRPELGCLVTFWTLD